MNDILTIQSTEKLRLHEDEFADVLSRAFYDDTYYSFIMPNDAKRMRQIRWWMKTLLRYTLKFGCIQYTSDKKGVALWLGPDRPMVNDFQILSMGMILYPFKVGVLNFLRLANISACWDKEHKKLDKRHYYLMVLGVAPSHQNSGLGSQLIQAGLERADHYNLYCFLEAVKESNVRFYQKHRFEVTTNEKFGKNGEYWLMKRKNLA